MATNIEEAQRLIYLFTSYQNSSLSAVESSELESWRKERSQNEEYFQKLTDHRNIDLSVRKMQAYDMPAKLSLISDRIVRRKKIYRQKFSYYIGVVAALSIFGLFIFLFKVDKPLPKQQVVSILKDVKAGSNQAYLTLGNGKRINLADASIGPIVDAKSGLEIYKTEDGKVAYKNKAESRPVIQYNTLETPKGGQYQVQLPDGTKVWLNAASTIKYPSSFSAAERLVELAGEAYFEVTKNRAMPFVVQSGNQKVTVLGTHFNINTYPDEPGMVTTLVEGSVQVTVGASTVKIKPGEQARVRNEHISKSAADLETALAWKEGEMVFKSAGVKTIMRQVARWYDLEITYIGKIPDDTFTGTINRQSSLATLLEMFEASQIHFQIEQGPTGKRLIIKP